ncbi:MAG: gfo/Idh/MocA family oxidoreductase [Caldilineae bacterium]|nr:MAG: gfo/Idh/MocA family oxidoreductase [Caldilineae bacterium]
MSEKVRLASVGLGWWGGVLADAVQRSGAAEIVACYARTESTRLAFAEKYGCRPAGSLEEILADPTVDGLLTATPHSHHAALITQAASAGKHIFVEKPLTLTVAEARKAIAAAQKGGIVLQVGHHRRRQGANRRLRAMIDNGELGVLHQFEANFSVFKPQPPTWRSNPAEQPLGALTGLGVHMIDTLHYLAGPIKQVFCFSKQITGQQPIDEATAALVEFERGALGYIGFSLCVPKVCTVAAFGNGASAWSEEEGSKLYFQRNTEFSRTPLPVDPGDAIAGQITEFARAIRGEATPETGGAEGLAVVEVMEALIESHKTGKPVAVADFR